jgi:hypothetical protein
MLNAGRNTWNTFPGSKIQQLKYSDNDRINYTISQNMQSLNEKNVNNVQHRISRDHPKRSSEGTQGENCMKFKWNYQDRVHQLTGLHRNQLAGLGRGFISIGFLYNK